jgi:glycine hydroxymethyltransferase
VNTPMVTSGIRLGTPALTSRGMEEAEMKTIGSYICDVLDAVQEEGIQTEVKDKVRKLAKRFPLYESRMS